MQHVRFTSARAVALGLLALCAVAAYTLTGRHVSAQPATRLAAASADSHGKAVYDAHCVECHGKTGKGDGPAAMILMPHPRDFSSGRYKIRSTETGSLPTDEDLTRSIRQGLFGTAMPAWQGILPDDDIREVVRYIKT